MKVVVAQGHEGMMESLGQKTIERADCSKD